MLLCQRCSVSSISVNYSNGSESVSQIWLKSMQMQKRDRAEVKLMYLPNRDSPGMHLSQFLAFSAAVTATVEDGCFSVLSRSFLGRSIRPPIHTAASRISFDPLRRPALPPWFMALCIIPLRVRTESTFAQSNQPSPPSPIAGGPRGAELAAAAAAAPAVGPSTRWF
jgi:hypothetical protein